MPKKKKVKSKPAPKEELQSFEQSLQDLEKVVSELESGNLTLSESLSKYEDGIKNLKICHRILETAENKIRVLTGVDRNGNPVTQEFDESATELHDRSDKKKFKATTGNDGSQWDEMDDDSSNSIGDDSGSLF